MNKDENMVLDRIEKMLVAIHEGGGHWHLKKEVTVAHILSTFAFLALLIASWYSLSGAVDAIAQRTENITDARMTAVETRQDMNEDHVQKSLDSIAMELRDINAKLDDKADR